MRVFRSLEKVWSKWYILVRGLECFWILYLRIIYIFRIVFGMLLGLRRNGMFDYGVLSDRYLELIIMVWVFLDL